MKVGLDLPPQIRVYGAFFIYSFAMGQIFPRFADLQQHMRVETGEFGLGLVGAPIGTLVTLTLASPVLARIGFRRALVTLIPLLMVLYTVASFASSPIMLFVLLFPCGLTIGCIELIINLEADRTEHLIGRRIMNRSHGFWSLGFFSAGLAGASLAQLGVNPQAHLALMIPVVIVATALVLGGFTPAPNRTGTSTAPPPRFARPSLAILVLVAVTLSAMLMEGAGIDWSAIYMKDVFDASPFLAGFAVATGAMTQAGTRFLADHFVERYNPTAVARVLLSILFVGALMVFFAPLQWIALVGFGVMGVGTSAIFPLAMSAAAQRTDRPSSINVAALAQISFITFLVGPPLLGSIAQAFGIRWIFGIGLPLIVLSFATAYALGSRPVAESPQPA